VKKLLNRPLKIYQGEQSSVAEIGSICHCENPYQPNMESIPAVGVEQTRAAERRFWACHIHGWACRKCAAFAPTLPLQNPRNARALPSSSATAPPFVHAARAAQSRGTQSGAGQGSDLGHCQARQALRMALAGTVASSSRTSYVSCQRSDSSNASSRHASGAACRVDRVTHVADEFELARRTG
jgi:hypothetical protein